MKRLFIFLAVAAVLASTAIPASCEDTLRPDPYSSGDLSSQYMGERILVDVLLLRPIGLVAIIAGLGGSLVAYPTASTSNSLDRVQRELIDRPWAYTFCRPVGDVDF